eukprot:757218-Hanusia_phi.AAC.5
MLNGGPRPTEKKEKRKQKEKKKRLNLNCRSAAVLQCRSAAGTESPLPGIYWAALARFNGCIILRGAARYRTLLRQY